MKTTIYVVMSLLLIAAGAIMLLLPNSPESGRDQIMDDFAISVMTGGLASLSFAIIRFFDDRDAERDRIKNRKRERKVYQRLIELHNKLRTLAIPGAGSGQRCIFTRHVTAEVGETIQSIPAGEQVKVDVIGLSLYRFWVEQVPHLVSRAPVHLRMLVQNPLESTFEILVQQEGRNLDVMRREIVQLSKQFTDTVETALAGSPRTGQGRRRPKKATVELRWFSGAASVTITRVNETLFVRPRFLNEGRDAPVFFERYDKTEQQCYSAYQEYFESAWDLAKVPTREMLSRAESMTAKEAVASSAQAGAGAARTIAPGQMDHSPPKRS